MNGKEIISKSSKISLRWSFRTTVQREGELWLIGGAALAWVAIFSYYPMYGIIYGFFNYYPGVDLFETEFVGLKHFIDFFKLPDVWLIFRNTLAISILNLTIGFVAPIVLALLFNEIGHTYFKRIIQTVSYLPYFVSWVVVASLIFAMLGGDGVVNTVLVKAGIIQNPIGFVTEGKNMWTLLVGTNVWKNIGYGSIIYLSAISGIEHELYQAGTVDGLSRWGMVKHITLPGIAPTILLLFILGIGGILNAGFEQQLLLGTPQTRDYYEVIDTYIYRYGIQLGNYSFSTAVGFFKSIIGILLVFATNALAKKTTDMSIF